MRLRQASCDGEAGPMCASKKRHTRKVKRAHFETCLIPENSELEGEVFSLAPGEGKKPLVILADPKF